VSFTVEENFTFETSKRSPLESFFLKMTEKKKKKKKKKSDIFLHNNNNKRKKATLLQGLFSSLTFLPYIKQNKTNTICKRFIVFFNTMTNVVCFFEGQSNVDSGLNQIDLDSNQ
jgi:hypothetical protein